MRNSPKKPRIAVAMSGGVDSSVAAWLLQEQGYAVSGVTMRISADTACVRQARAVAEHLSIPHRVVDASAVFQRDVIDYFCRQYCRGTTPNPCLRCNQYVKFGEVFNRIAPESLFATGHYARVNYHAAAQRYELLQGLDAKKDQSYVLYMLTQKQLKRVVFPLGALTKDAVRTIAVARKLPVRLDEESQDICFIPDKDYVRFILQHSAPSALKPGDIVLHNGTVLGRHEGILHYTIGQRKGLGIAYKKPLFVKGFDVKKNQVIVAEEAQLYDDWCEIAQVSFVDGREKKSVIHAAVKIRYHHRPAAARIWLAGSGRWNVEFAEPQKALTPGQGAVFYDQERVIGGGIITRVSRHA